jgi:hypothetical protein
MTIAASFEAGSLARYAGTMGEILAAQSGETSPSFGRDALRPGSARRRISLARSAA